MKVILVNFTPFPEETVAAAAKLCYSPDTPETVFNNIITQKENVAEASLENLITLEHFSPLEHSSFTFAISGISRVCLAQLVRHRIASPSVRSQRNVSEGTSNVVFPPAVLEIETAARIYEDAVQHSFESYKALCNIMTERYLSEGFGSKVAEKKAIEDARYILPESTETTLFFTINARSLLNFFSLRCCNRAQWEIRELANEMLRLCKNVAPTLFKNAGAPCVTGHCHEGKLSCGSPYRQEFDREITSD